MPENGRVSISVYKNTMRRINKLAAARKQKKYAVIEAAVGALERQDARALQAGIHPTSLQAST